MRQWKTKELSLSVSLRGADMLHIGDEAISRVDRCHNLGNCACVINSSASYEIASPHLTVGLAMTLSGQLQ